MKIKAYAIKKQGGVAEPFTYERKVGKDDVLVKVSHCSIARGDVQFIDNAWGDTKFPLVPSHEIIGIVEKTGSKVSGLKCGDRVGIGYQQEACFKCQFCREGNEQFCPVQKVIGVDRYGGLAEYIALDGRFAFKIPQKLDSAKSTPLLSSGLTVYSAIRRADLPPNSTVAVLGVGGLGTLAIQFLHKMGHQVFAFSHSPTKKKLIEALGAEYIDSSKPADLAKFNRKFDLILSTLNVDFDVDSYLRMLRPRGKFCLVAQPPQQTGINLGLLYDYAQRTIYGNYVGSRKDMTAMLAFSAKHNIDGMVEVMPFAEVNEAIDIVRRGQSTRVVLENRR